MRRGKRSTEATVAVFRCLLRDEKQNWRKEFGHATEELIARKKGTPVLGTKAMVPESMVSAEGTVIFLDETLNSASSALKPRRRGGRA